MGINNIQLSKQLLAVLYPDSLVREKDRDGTPQVSYRFLGNNLRKVCFLVQHPDAVYLPEDQLEFLSRILSACHCTIADVAVLNLAKIPVDITELRRQLNPEILFLCGVDPVSLHLPGKTALFDITLFEEISLLLIPPIDAMNRKTAESRQLKTKLWECLQKLFRL